MTKQIAPNNSKGHEMLRNLPMRGQFRGFDCDSTTTLNFTRINLIYGRNGTGKTSLSDSLRAWGALPDPADLDVRPNIKVFNKYYVEESLSQFVDGSSHAPAVAIGKENVELKRSQNLIKHQIESRTSIEAALRKSSDAVPSLRQIAADAKEAVTSTLGLVDAKYHRNQYRNTEQLRKKIANLSFTPSAKTDTELQGEATLTEVASEAPSPIVAPSIKINSQLVSDVITTAHDQRHSLDPSITGELLHWLSEGISYISSKEQDEKACPFCKISDV